MKKVSPKKPRNPGLVFTVDKSTKTDGFIIGPDGYLALAYQGKPIDLSYAAVELTYDRPKGRKVLFQAPLDPKTVNLDPNAPLLAYDLVYAVDTNTKFLTKFLHGERVSVVCATQGVRHRRGMQILIERIPFFGIELRNVTGDPERVGWRFFCNAVMESPDYNSHLRIAILVDSSLDSLRDINARSSPVVGDWMLPANFTLLYASTDSATATIGNQLMRTTDSTGTRILQLIAQIPPNRNLHEAPPGAGYSHYRHWVRNK